MREVANLLAKECRDKGVDVLLSPMLNLHRSPLGGRHFEAFSEDPLLTGRIGVAFVLGLQERGVGACIKHFVCNDAETDRRDVSNVVAERPLRELYLAPFARAVREAAPWAAMSAYNWVNGVPMSQNALLAEPLKGERGPLPRICGKRTPVLNGQCWGKLAPCRTSDSSPTSSPPGISRKPSTSWWPASARA